MKKEKLMRLLEKGEIVYDDKEFIEVWTSFNTFLCESNFEMLMHILNEYKKYSGDMSLETISLSLAEKLSEEIITSAGIKKMSINEMINECY